MSISIENDDGRRYKLLVLDIDGTLLTSRAEVAASTVEALERARAAGLAVTFATGRRLSTVTPYCDQLGITLPVILQSGAQIVDPASGAVLYRNPLPREEVATIVRALVAERLQPLVYENLALGQHLMTGPEEYDTTPMRYYVVERPGLLRRMTYDDLILVPDPLEVATIDDLARLEPVAERLILANCRTLISYSMALDSYFLEIFHATCSKGEALGFLTSHLGITMSEVVAVGDNYNDREMLQVAGLGVAMGNAEPEIIAVADRVTRSNDDDGIAALVDELLNAR